MRVWSIRTLEEISILKQNGVLHTNFNKIDKNYLVAYQWMSKQLCKKTAPPPNVEYPLWVWKQWESLERAKPDLRSNCLLPSGVMGARLELEIPDDLVLLSDFDGWHAVLNNHYHAVNDHDYDNFSKLKEKNELSFEEIEKMIKNSWLQIFDVKNFGDSIQGVVWEIKEEYIKNIKTFKSR